MYGDLTKTGLDYSTAVNGLLDLISGLPVDRRKFYNSQDETMAAANDAIRTMPHGSINVGTPQGVAVAAPGEQPMPAGIEGPGEMAPPEIRIANPNTGLTIDTPQAKLPKFVHPTFKEASTDRFGNVTPGASPGLTKRGALLKILKGGLQGGVDAMAGGALDAPQHGESTFGRGVAAAQQMPLIRAANQQRQERGDVENLVERANLAMLPLRIAAQQAQLKNLDAETNYRNAHAKYLESTLGAKDQMDLQHLYAQAVQNGDEEAAQRYADAITSLQRPAGEKTESPFVVWRQQNPNAPVSQYFDEENRSRAKYRVGDDSRDPQMKPATRGQLASVTVRKKNAEAKLKAQYRYVSGADQYEDTKTGDRISPEEYTSRKQDIQDAYEEELAAITGNELEHVTYDPAEAHAQGTTPAPTAEAAPKVDVSKARQVARDKSGTTIYEVGGKWYTANGQPYVAKAN